MTKMFWVCLLVFGLILSWTLVYAGDFYVIPTKKKNYAPPQKTGQTTPYRPHDDGNLAKGVTWPSPRFTDNNNGTVTDNLTGLIWLKDTNCAGGTVNWNMAIDYCAALYDGCTTCFGAGVDCGLSDGSSAGDWRLPNITEQHSLIDFGYYNPTLSNTAGTDKWSEDDPFTGLQSTYWSSTTDASSTGSSWYLGFYSGSMNAAAKTVAGAHVWCVRGGN